MQYSRRRKGAHLNDLLIGHTRQEDMLFILVGMEPNNVRNFAIAEPFDALPRLRVPELDLTIIAAGQESPTIVRKSDVFYGFHVAVEGT